MRNEIIQKKKVQDLSSTNLRFAGVWWEVSHLLRQLCPPSTFCEAGSVVHLSINPPIIWILMRTWNLGVDLVPRDKTIVNPKGSVPKQ
jgi:hypothetical protein